MATPITLSAIDILPAAEIAFGISGLSLEEAYTLMRSRLRERWPDQSRPDQSVYVVRLVGEVAVSYPTDFSPVVYIGEGHAYNRMYQHIPNWIAPLLISVPQLAVEIRIVEAKRQNHGTFYKHIEADLLAWFQTWYGAIPWFNQQLEGSKAGVYDYEPDARRALEKLISVGSGSVYRWAIQPTKNNEHHTQYSKGHAGT